MRAIGGGDCFKYQAYMETVCYDCPTWPMCQGSNIEDCMRGKRKAMTRLPRMRESDLKKAIKDYLDLSGIFSFPIVQSIGSYRGAPDRIIHLNGKAVYLELKLPKGKMSDHQLVFQEQCKADGISYWVIKSVEELEERIKEVR